MRRLRVISDEGAQLWKVCCSRPELLLRMASVVTESLEEARFASPAKCWQCFPWSTEDQWYSVGRGGD